MKAVLVVDDEFGITEVVEDILTEAGMRVMVAGNGRQALDRLDESAPDLPDLILLDFMMPELNGPGLLRALAARSEYRDIPVIMMSSLDEPAVAERCEGYIGYMRKPFTVAEVLGVVERALGEA